MSTQKTYTEITPQEALKTLYEAGGMPVGGFAFRDREGHAWMESALSGADIGTANQYHFRAVTGEAFAHCARVTITSPIAAGHNPDKLTEEQVGVSEGWRLLAEEELSARDGETSEATEYWSMMGKEWCSDGSPIFAGIGAYRTKQPAGYYLPKPKTLTPWTFETAPKGCVLFRKKARPDLITLCIGWHTNGVATRTDCAPMPYGEVLEIAEHSTDGGATWKSCGTEA